jgi:hypothetical protein
MRSEVSYWVSFELMLERGARERRRREEGAGCNVVSGWKSSGRR